ncbi:MAG TPA: PIN domain-containing protein [Burkholderiales bacterium]|nr:PIN domain-containing protein [Burkholderiales bacterium]
MEIAGFLAQVPEGAALTIDSAPIIYYLEDHPVYADRFAPVFDAVAEGRIQAVISAVTLAEVLSGPLASGNEVLATQYREVLCRSPGWQMYPVDEEVAETGARMRIRYKLRLPDAIQIATAIVTRSHALVTHDAKLGKIRDITVLGSG